MDARLSLKALDHFLSVHADWGPSLKELNFDEIYFYVSRWRKRKSWDDVPDDIKRTSINRRAGGGAQVLRASARNTSPRWSITPSGASRKQGVIFVSIEDGLKKYPDLFREYFGTVIPIEIINSRP